MEHVSVRGVEVPALGFGTWPLRGDDCRQAVETALDLGYRHVDTAQMYENEAAVGAAIEESSVDREDVFLVTKILRRNLAREDVRRSVEASLEQLGTDIDLLLIHSPSHSVPIEESIGAMNALQADGAVAHIGVSNFSVDQLRDAIAASETPILTNQVEYHPLRSRADLLDCCIENDVMLTAYSPLSKGDVVGNPTLTEIGDRYGKTAAQVAIRWLLQQDRVSAIPKAAAREHQAENLAVFDFELTDDEMRAVFELQGGIDDGLATRLWR